MRSFFVAAVVVAALVACASAEWSIVAKNLLTTDLGIGFIDDKTGYTAGDANGSGPEILKSTDGGVTWNACQANFGIDMLLLALDAADKSIVVSSIFGELYSDDDGASFHIAIGGGLSQSVRYVGTDGDGGEKYGVAGTYGGKQGVALSTNGGKTFKPFTTDSIFTLARYATYPTDTTWYVASGEWPNQGSDDQTPSNDDFNNDDMPSRPRRFRKSAFQTEDGYFPRSFVPSGIKDVNGYAAQLSKTTDGGQTYTTLFAQNGTFYFNEIDCNPANPNHCCAVGESPDGPAPGARIYCTFDGQNFNRTFFQAGTQSTAYSLMGIRFAGENLIWAAGSVMNSIAPSAWFVKSTDGGKTWEADSNKLFGYATLGLDVVDENTAFAAIDDLITQTSGIARWNP